MVLDRHYTCIIKLVDALFNLRLDRVLEASVLESIRVWQSNKKDLVLTLSNDYNSEFSLIKLILFIIILNQTGKKNMLVR
jgi:predicted transcriptional regulator with HTH domain